MADKNTAPTAETEATPIDQAKLYQDACAAYKAAETALVKFHDVCEDLVHDEASSLRGLADTILAGLRSGKPGGA